MERKHVNLFLLVLVVMLVFSVTLVGCNKKPPAGNTDNSNDNTNNGAWVVEPMGEMNDLEYYWNKNSDLLYEKDKGTVICSKDHLEYVDMLLKPTPVKEEDKPGLAKRMKDVIVKYGYQFPVKLNTTNGTAEAIKSIVYAPKDIIKASFDFDSLSAIMSGHILPLDYAQFAKMTKELYTVIDDKYIVLENDFEARNLRVIESVYKYNKSYYVKGTKALVGLDENSNSVPDGCEYIESGAIKNKKYERFDIPKSVGLNIDKEALPYEFGSNYYFDVERPTESFVIQQSQAPSVMDNESKLIFNDKGDVRFVYELRQHHFTLIEPNVDYFNPDNRKYFEIERFNNISDTIKNKINIPYDYIVITPEKLEKGYNDVIYNEEDKDPNYKNEFNDLQEFHQFIHNCLMNTLHYTGIGEDKNFDTKCRQFINICKKYQIKLLAIKTPKPFFTTSVILADKSPEIANKELLNIIYYGDDIANNSWGLRQLTLKTIYRGKYILNQDGRDPLLQSDYLEYLFDIPSPDYSVDNNKIQIKDWTYEKYPNLLKYEALRFSTLSFYNVLSNIDNVQYIVDNIETLKSESLEYAYIYENILKYSDEFDYLKIACFRKVCIVYNLQLMFYDDVVGENDTNHLDGLTAVYAKDNVEELYALQFGIYGEKHTLEEIQNLVEEIYINNPLFKKEGNILYNSNDINTEVLNQILNGTYVKPDPGTGPDSGGGDIGTGELNPEPIPSDAYGLEIDIQKDKFKDLAFNYYVSAPVRVKNGALTNNAIFENVVKEICERNNKDFATVSKDLFNILKEEQLQLLICQNSSYDYNFDSSIYYSEKTDEISGIKSIYRFQYYLIHFEEPTQEILDNICNTNKLRYEKYDNHYIGGQFRNELLVAFGYARWQGPLEYLVKDEGNDVVLIDVGGRAMIGTRVVIPSFITKIGYFTNCNMEEIYIPKTVKSISSHFMQDAKISSNPNEQRPVIKNIIFEALESEVNVTAWENNYEFNITYGQVLVP